jgi:TrmH family RNA methyltransferase
MMLVSYKDAKLLHLRKQSDNKMLTQKQLKFVNELKQKKYRAEYNLFIAEGVKIVSELLASKIVVKQVFATTDFLKNSIIPKHIECIEVKPSELERLSAQPSPNEVLAVCEIPEYILTISELQNKLTLVLDNIRDPGNLGTIIRVADWFGIDRIVCSDETADAFNPKVVQATMGSIARIKVHYTNLTTFFAEFKSDVLLNKNLPVYGALLDGENIYTTDLTAAGLIIIGNESKGISDEMIPFITKKLNIPSFSYYKSSAGEAESLNAAIATSIICSEFRRRG